MVAIWCLLRHSASVSLCIKRQCFAAWGSRRRIPALNIDLGGRWHQVISFHHRWWLFLNFPSHCPFGFPMLRIHLRPAIRNFSHWHYVKRFVVILPEHSGPRWHVTAACHVGKFTLSLGAVLPIVNFTLSSYLCIIDKRKKTRCWMGVVANIFSSHLQAWRPLISFDSLIASKIIQTPGDSWWLVSSYNKGMYHVYRPYHRTSDALDLHRPTSTMSIQSQALQRKRSGIVIAKWALSATIQILMQYIYEYLWS